MPSVKCMWSRGASFSWGAAEAAGLAALVLTGLVAAALQLGFQCPAKLEKEPRSLRPDAMSLQSVPLKHFRSH